MITFFETPHFSQWLSKLKDLKGRMSIVRRIDRAQLGNFGDIKSVGEGVSEMRIDSGPGYRLYYTKQEEMVVILLVGGDKSSQERDIVKAKELAKEYK